MLAPPEIRVEPQDNLAAPGQNVDIAAVPAGDDPLTLQWFRNGAPLPAATNAVLHLTGVTSGQAGTYWLVVTNLVGAVTSAPAVLVVGGTAVTAGNINGTWTAGNSPYVVAADFAINNLTVQAGAQVWVNGAHVLTVTGLLTVAGTSSSPVMFGGVGWGGLHFVSASAGSSLTWAVVRHAAAGGIRCTNTALALTNCVIDSNSGSVGGGIYADGLLRMEGCAVVNNTALLTEGDTSFYAQGGGIYVAGGAATLRRCVISNNTAVMPDIGEVTETSTGGGIHAEAGSVTLSECTVVSNIAAGFGPFATALGGGVYANAAFLTATGCVFSGNDAPDGFGGAVAASQAALTACAFRGNHAVYGGALHTGGTGRMTASNCLLTGNAADGFGGGVYGIGLAAGDFENCTVTSNAPDGFHGFGGLIHDSIVWGNTGANIVGSPTVNFSDVEGGFSGQNNLDVDPQFADAASLLLGDGSPCIDAGDPDGRYNDGAFPPAQLYGGDVNDLGAYGGPGGALWPQFAGAAPVVLVNGQAAAPYQVFTFVNTSAPTISLANGFPGGSFGYSLGSATVWTDRIRRGISITAGAFLLGDSAEIRAVAYNAAQDNYTISAPVFVNLPPAFAFAAGTAGGGSVTPAGGTFLSNSTVNLTATASNGWQFLYWTNGASGDNPATTVTLNGPLTNVQAVFGTGLALHITPIGAGTIQSNPAAILYPYGSRVQLTAVPAATRYFTNWNAPGITTNFVSPLDLTMTNATPSVTAIFGNRPAGQFWLTVLLTNGDVTRLPEAPLYASNTTVSMTAGGPAGLCVPRVGRSGGRREQSAERDLEHEPDDHGELCLDERPAARAAVGGADQSSGGRRDPIAHKCHGQRQRERHECERGHCAGRVFCGDHEYRDGDQRALSGDVEQPRRRGQTCY